MKLLFVDDHPIMLDGLKALLVHSRPDAIVLTARSAREAFALANAHPDLDVVLLDLKMPDLDGHAAIGEMRRIRPDLPVIVLSSSEEPADVRRALAAGAFGYVPKSASQRALMSAIDLVMDGELYVPPLLVQTDRSEEPVDVTLGQAVARLTDRQKEVLALLSQGRSNKSIARQFGLSEKTVKIHVSAIFKILNVRNRTQAAAAGRSLGLI